MSQQSGGSGHHTAEDGSFGRSASGALARGIALVAAAVILGLILLNATDSGSPFKAAGPSGGGGAEVGATTTTAAGGAIGAATTTTLANTNPATVTVLVANGSGVKGAGQRTTDVVKAGRYKTLAPTNTTAVAAVSMVYFTPGYDAAARAVAGLLVPAPKVAPMPNPIPVGNLGGANILVVVAKDLAGGGPTTGATTTTVHKTASTTTTR